MTTKSARQLRVKRDLSYTVRREEYQGRTHVVVPVVALVETVVFASNASNPELVTAEEFSRVPEGWNGRPVYSGHPSDGSGKYVSGNSPEVLETKCIGIVFNAKAEDGKLHLEAWLDEERTKEIEPQLLERIESGDAGIEVSVGVFVSAREESGVYDEKRYAAVWEDIVPDHLAILPVGETGACSVEAGCGVRAAKEKTVEAPKPKSLMERIGLARLAQALRSAIAPEDMSDNDLRRSLYEALQKQVGHNMGYVEAIYDDRVIYCTFSTADGYYSTHEYYSRGYAVAANGAVTLDGDATEVEPVMTYPPKAKAGDAPAEARAAKEEPVARAACSCQEISPATPAAPVVAKETAMNDVLKALLEAATPEQLAKIEADLRTPAPAAAAAPAPAAAAAPAPAAVEVKEPTLADLLAKAPADVKAEYESARQAAESKRATTIKALKDGGCKLSDERLASMTQVELETLTEMLPKPTSKTFGQVDFSGQAPRNASAATETEAPKPPSMAERLLASRK